MGRKAKSAIVWLITRAIRRGRVFVSDMSLMAVRGSAARERQSSSGSEII